MASALGNQIRSHWKMWTFLLLVIIVVVIVVLAVTGKFGEGRTAAQKLGPNAPANQVPVVAKRNDNGKYQVLLTTSTTSGAGTSGTRVWNQVYYIMFNPTTSADDTTLVFYDTFDAAAAYYNSNFVANPLNKTFTAVSTNPANADYTNITPV